MFSANSSQVSEDRLYVEDVFSTYLYTGNGSSQTITNGIDLAGKGGLVWIKSRSTTTGNILYDTSRGVLNFLRTNTTGAQGSSGTRGVTAFNSNGFSVFDDFFDIGVNVSPNTYASWTFREAPKFFDVVTYTGNGSSNQTISHNLGIAPGCIIVKRTDSANGWIVYHRGTSVPNNTYLTLQTTNAATNLGADRWSVTSTSFNANDSDLGLNASGGTYVAYLFAHDTTSDGIIQCGSYTGTSAAGNAQNLGWEPQWLMVKSSSGVGDWFMLDNMRGIPTGSNDACLLANSSNAEFANADRINLTSTGFQFGGSDLNNSGTTYIYIAIRRGPMRTPTSGTSVFSPDFFGGGTVYYNSGFPTDLALTATRAGDTYNTSVADRLRGGNNTLVTSSTAAQLADTTNYFDNMVGYGLPYTGGTSTATIGWLFRRAPSFFDEVCYTGTGSARTVNHNLGVVPEMIIVKSRTQAGTYWMVQHSALGPTKDIYLQSTNAASTRTAPWNDTAPTSTVFTVGTDSDTNGSGQNLVAYLFASCPGVSKVGSYTGNGSSQTINCGFAAGARFVMIKRTDSTGDWYVWDTARGIVSGNDPRLSLNSTAAEVTTDDSVDTDSSGFVVNQLSATNINVNAATYLYMAVA